MKNIKEILKMLKKGDYAVVLITVFISSLLFALSFSSDEKIRAEVYLDGEPLAVIKLYEIENQQQLIAGNCTLLMESDGVTFVDSCCEDRLCINRGKLKKAGDTMACVPERVSIVLRAEKNEADAIVF